MPAQEVESKKKVEYRATSLAPLLTPIGERISKGEIIPYSEFYTQSLPKSEPSIVDFCSTLTSTLANQVKETANGRYITFNQRGSNTRRGCWNFVQERNGYPVGNYNSITPWWESYFTSESNSYRLQSNQAKVKRILTQSPSHEVDLRLEFLLSQDRTDYFTNRRDFADLTINIVPDLIQQLILDTQTDLYVDGKYFIKGIPPFANIDSGHSTYIGYKFDFYEPNSEKPVLTLDLGTGNFWRTGLFEAHNVSEPHLEARENGLSLNSNNLVENSPFVNPFKRRFQGDAFTASRGLQGYDILSCGTRQTYIGAFHDPSSTPQIDPVVTDVAYELKFKYKIVNSHRAPEISANTIVAHMADPLYAVDSFRLTDYFRQFKNLEWLANRPNKQAQLRNAIEKRMTKEYFVAGVWDPFLIIDALNEIGMPIKRDFSCLVKTFTL